jgi:hypothetical protein
VYIRPFFPAVFISSLVALPVTAQTAPIVGWIETTATTGMIGLVNGQTAQLSVLNLKPVVTATPAPANCNVQLEFFDSVGAAVGPSKVVTNFAPQSAVFLDADRLTLNPSGVSAAPRGQIRGVVTVNPPLPTAISGSGQLQCDGDAGDYRQYDAEHGGADDADVHHGTSRAGAVDYCAELAGALNVGRCCPVSSTALYRRATLSFSHFTA